MSLKPLPANVLTALQAGRTIEAIKLLRHSEGIGLKEAKEAVDAHLGERRASTRAPGEVARMSGAAWWIVAILVVAAIGVWVLRQAS